MTDRELLELAAKAAGIYLEEGEGEFMFWDFSCDPAVLREWNPLTADGDALRLAVSLKLAVFPPEHDSGDFAVASIPDGVVDESNSDIWIQHEVKNGDRMEATRRAIVRAAAEIGKEMK